MPAPGSVAIRPYEPRHLGETARVWRDSFASSAPPGIETASLAELSERLPGEVASGWRVYLAFEGERIVAFMALSPSETCLRQLFVAPEAQGRGVGRALLDLAKQALGEGLWLRTAEVNAGARRFYEREGLKLAGIAPHPRYGNPTATYRWR